MLLQLIGISKSYGVDTVLNHIHLLVNERERIGLVGVNGAGKSTLLKIISGEMSADEGEIIKAKEAKIGYLAQNNGLHSDRSIWEEMLTVFDSLRAMEHELRALEQQMAEIAGDMDHPKTQVLMERYAEKQMILEEKGGYAYEAKIRGVLHGLGFAGFSPATKVGTLSGGQKTRLGLAKLLLAEPELLLLDEPTNYLDIPTLTWLEGYLQQYPGALLIVSHDRYFLDRLVQTIVEIERTEAKKYTGNYSRFIELKAEEYAIQLKHYEKQQDEISRMEDFVQRNIVRATTTKRAQSRRKALERIERIDQPANELKRAYFQFEAERTTGKDVLFAEQLQAGYEGNPPLFQNVNFELKRGERVALIGPNGIGKSTLLKTLIGQIQPQAGLLRWGAHVELGYYDQEQQGLNPNKTVLDEVWDIYPHMEEARIRTVLGNFLFVGDEVFKKVSSLSGGEKARVSLAKLMLQQANVLIMDEPTNHLDLYSKEVLEGALDEFEGTLLFISHDRYFLNRLADRIIELHPSGVESYLGNYDDYIEKKKAKEDLLAAAKVNVTEETPANKSNYAAEKQQKREDRQRQRKLVQLEQDIEAWEKQITDLEAEICLPEVYSNYVILQEKNALLEQTKQRLNQAYEEWEELLALS